MSRIPFVDAHVLEQVAKLGLEVPIKTKARACVIIEKFIGRTFMVHNGKDWIKVVPSADMIGHRLGEFSPTRKPVKHAGHDKYKKAMPVKKSGAKGGKK